MPAKSPHVSVLDDLGNAQAPKGSKEWLAFWINEGKLVSRKLDDDAGDMQRILKLLEQFKAHQVLGKVSFELLCREEFGFDPHQIEAIKKARKSARLGSVIEQARAQPLGHVKAGPGRGHKTLDDVKCFPSGNSIEYISRRLARDQPQLLEAVERGELSPRQAGIKAGFIKVAPILHQLKKLWDKASPEEQQQFLALIGRG